MKQNPPTKRPILLSICAAVTLALLAACGGSSAGGGNAAAATPTVRVVPTMPQARFAAPTTMISSGSGTVTETGAVTATEATGTREPDATPTVDLERGARVYANENCAECHGAEGEGVADKGSAIAGTTLSEAAFSDLMRTGGSIGPDHLYGPTAISPGGLTALHAWLQSLPPAE